MTVERWVSKRLKVAEIPEYTSWGGRQIQALTRKHIKSVWMKVPLGTGVGNALLLTPADDCSEARNALVVCTHGFGGGITEPFWQWSQHFVGKGLSVLLFEWDGHGPHVTSHLDFSQASRTLPLVIQKIFDAKIADDATACRMEPPQCYLLGHSLGATLSLLAASRSDTAKYISGVIAVSPLMSLLDEKAHQTAYRRGKMSSQELIRASKSSFFAEAGRPYSKVQKAEPLLSRGAPSSDQVAHFVTSCFTDPSCLENIKSPVLWVHAKDDGISDYRKTNAIMRTIPSSLFVHSERKSGHFLVLQREGIAGYIYDFIMRLDDNERQRTLAMAEGTYEAPEINLQAS